MTKEQLLAFYMHSGKQASYQPLPAFVVEHLGVDVPIHPRWRAEHGRLDSLKNHFDFSEQRLLDAGANTGLFTTTLANEIPTCDRLGREGTLSEFCLRPLFKLV